MYKPKNILIPLSSFILFFCLHPGLLKAESEEVTLSINEEPAALAVDAQTEYIHLEQSSLKEIQKNDAFPQERRTPAQGKSILNFTQTMPDALSALPKTPKTPAEAQKLGWKQKTVKIPQPVANLVKETPKEIIAKKARQKAKEGQRRK